MRAIALTFVQALCSGSFGVGVGSMAARGVPKFANRKSAVSPAEKCGARTATSRPSADDASLCLVWPATSCAPAKPRNAEAQHIPARHVSLQREKPGLLDKVA
ncbi:unnamed protein product [Effrenium voratum]|uniref:Secreted protein n=1 Tax=Effrenium voratum TaxID=2562239 RepID=A0AA36IHJ0_9DINO|nr:unnamed protein product [Effrenium voratum]CAJ1453048.1 unnamed protein product [Effrenium voratum]